MFSRKECKQKARRNLFKHYLLFVFICLAAAIAGTEYSSSYKELTEEVKLIVSGGDTETENVGQHWQVDTALDAFLKDHDQAREMIGSMIEQQKEQQSTFLFQQHIEIGHNEGVLAKVTNEFKSGAFIVRILSALHGIAGSAKAGAVIFIVLAVFGVFVIWTFITNVIKVVYARIFLEGRIYKRIPMQRMAFLIYVRKWGKAAMTMLLKAVYYNLWLLTVIGGIIKRFSYFAVPYIVAENPDIAASKAIKLSRDMMNGHKWECFKLEFSFIGWDILDALTFGLVGILYANPYREASMSEYYVYIREQAKEKRIEGIDALNDRYLFELPSDEVLAEAYGTAAEYEVTAVHNTRGVWNKILDFLGIYFRESENERYKQYLKQKERYDSVRYILAKEEYGYRLYPIPEKKRFNVLEHLYYKRKYSIWSVILLFAFFSCLGWVWEVSQHMIQYGDFVNRGVLHGPWLPIYGTGGVVILLLLNKLRDNPTAEFFSAIALCGVLEYLSGYVLELMHQGQKWWSYTGYFLNIDGRVCAEGLLVFGLGGMIFVYLVAPLFDNICARIGRKGLIVISAVFLAAFTFDMAYSSVNPNTGEGITSYRESQQQYPV